MKHILLVIAENGLATTLQEALQDHFGGEVHVAESLQTARTALQWCSYSLVLTDLRLPDAPHGECIDALLQTGVPIIVLTSDLSSEGRQELLDKGIVDYIFKDEPQVISDVIQAIERTDKNRETAILVVDANPESLASITLCLQRYLFAVQGATTGTQALQLFDARTDVKVVIVEADLPDMDGMALCSRLRKRKARNELAIIGVSAAQEGSLSARFLKKGANDFLTKPFQREELYARLLQNLDTLEVIAKKEQLLRTIQKMNQRMQRDLEAAAEVQQRLLPYSLPEIPGIKTNWYFQPCEQLAGDALGVFKIDAEHLGLYVLDVSGHGVPAALLAVSAVQTLQLHATSPESSSGSCNSILHTPQQVMELLDREFPLERFDKFLTIVYGVLNTNSGCLQYSVAGHPPPFLVHRDGYTEVLDTGGSFVGLGGAIPFESRTVCLQPGDKVVFYSDGVTEMVNENGEEYGLQRLKQMLETHGRDSVDECIETVRRSLDEFGRRRVPRDDISLLCVGRAVLGASSKASGSLR
ncbi:fused response regulator/phosphatase [Desulfohalobium retbaense]|uniref:Response regulator receiver modulated serine phosphatase n=1 Tax=Desulfohalobium retbaense (strain ATCC 49708 / DSM 5692 / JCM 16813 / HR100) TaxID=485915 RepID=C8X119_DESRD|nr:fused response regulator/phosphatase [Desulfohalobium retbaense]ACV68116.1 response regulator receiver modulated serine phosphatase [Desulfohalobium retbaense DSM 5692]